MNNAQRAFIAMKGAEALGIPPELRRTVEEISDILHGYFSSVVAGSKLTWTEYLEAIKDLVEVNDR